MSIGSGRIDDPTGTSSETSFWVSADRVRKVLRLETEAAMPMVYGTVFARCASEEVARVELHPRRVGLDQQRSS